MRGKRGLSPIILTVLTIVMVLGALTVIWSSLKPNLDDFGDSTSSQACLSVSLNVVECQFNSSTTLVRIKRDAGSGDLTDLRFVFSLDDSQITRDITSGLPSQLETRTYYWAEPFTASQVDVAAMVDGHSCAPSGTPRSCLALDFLRAPPACSDGIDNDGDTLIDFPLDLGCSNTEDTDETDGALTACSDTLDNDGDGLIDEADPGCIDRNDDDELDEILGPACNDGLDNDGDGLEDYPTDPGCITLGDNDELNAPNDVLYVYAWNLFNYSLTNMVEFTMFGTEQNYAYPHFGLGYRSLNAQYIKNFTDTQHARGGLSAIMDWDLWGGGSNIFNRDIRAPLMNHSLDRCKNPDGSFTSFPCPWRDNGISETAALYDDFFSDLSQAGVRLDMLILDIEPAFGWWTITNWPCAGVTDFAQCQNAHFPQTGAQYIQALQNDPRNTSLFSELGFQNLTRIWNNYRVLPDYEIFDGVMIGKTARDINTAIYETARRYYPSIQVSNYGFDYSRLPTPNYAQTFNQYIPSGQGHVGTHQAPSIYTGSFINICNNPTTDTYYLCNIGSPGYIQSTPFNGFRYAANTERSGLLTSNVPMAPWISYKTLPTSAVRSSDLYQELIMHLALTNPSYLLAWNPHPWQAGLPGGSYASNQTDYIIDSTVKEIQKLVWYPGRQTRVTALESWRHDFYLSGMSADGRTVWRFTPDLDASGGNGIQNTIVSELGGVVVETPHYRLTFPGAVIYRPSNPVSTQGLWIVQPGSHSNPLIEES